MCVARQIGENLFGAGERALGIDHPFASLQWREECGEGLRIGKPSMRAKERELAGTVSGEQHLDDEPAEQTREHAHGQEEAGTACDPAFAIVGETASGHDHVHVRMVCHGAAPGVQHRRDADPGAEPLLVGRDRECGLGGSLEQDVVDDGLVGVGEIGDRARQRIDDVEVRDGQQLGFPLFQPLARRRALALGTVAVATTVVGDVRVPARIVLATRNMTAEGCCATALDCRHHLHLGEAHMAAIGLTPNATVVAEDVRDLQSGPCHRQRLGRAPGLAPTPLGALRHVELIERALHCRDQAGRDPRVARRRLQLLVSEQRLDRPDVGAAIEQVRGEAVPERVQRHLLLDAGGGERLLEETRHLPRRQMRVLAPAGKKPALGRRYAIIVVRAPDRPPLAQQRVQLRRQHHVPVLAALALLDADDAERLIEVADLQLDGLADTQTCAVADREQHTRLQVAGHREQPRRFLAAQDLRDPRRLLDVVDLVGEIEPAHRHAEQEAQARHGAVARLDRGAGLHQLQLEQPHVADLSALRELSGNHVLDHALTKRADGGRVGHGERLPE